MLFISRIESYLFERLAFITDALDFTKLVQDDEIEPPTHHTNCMYTMTEGRAGAGQALPTFEKLFHRARIR
jgi:hypothetical protein